MWRYSLSSDRGHSMPFAKFLMLKFSKSNTPLTVSYSFHQISTKLYGTYGDQGRIQPITFFAIIQMLKLVCHFEIFLNAGPYEAASLKMQLP